MPTAIRLVGLLRLYTAGVANHAHSLPVYSRVQALALSASSFSKTMSVCSGWPPFVLGPIISCVAWRGSAADHSTLL